MEIKTFKFKNDTVEIDVAFDGEIYINATEVYQAFGKSRENFSYWKKTYLVPYVEKLIQLGKFPCQEILDAAKSVGCSVDNFIIQRNGGIPHEQGTWLHPKLSIVFARWLDLEFEIWCDEKIAELLSTGVTYMRPEDRKYADLLSKITDHTTSSDKQFARLIKSMLTLQEQYGYNISKFTELLDNVSEHSDKANRYKLYEKIIKVIEDLYQTGVLDITTRERMKKACEVRLISLLKTRVTKAENKLKFQSFKLKNVTSDKETHDKLVELTTNLVQAQNDLVIAQNSNLGGASIIPTDGSLAVMNLVTNDIHNSLKFITDTCHSQDYRIFFQSCLSPKNQVDGKKLPNFTGEYVIPQKGRIGAAIWNNNKFKFLRLSKYGFDGNPFTIFDLYLNEVADSEGTYRAVNKAGTICAIYNEPTGMLVVYGFKATKN